MKELVIFGNVVELISLIVLIVFLIIWILVGIDIYQKSEVIKEEHDTVSSFYSEKNDDQECVSGSRRLFFWSVLLMTAGLAVSNLSLFLFRVFSVGESVLDTTAFTLLMFCSLSSILLLFPLYLKEQTACCLGADATPRCNCCCLPSKMSEILHQWGGAALLAGFPTINAVIYFILYYHCNHTKITNAISAYGFITLVFFGLIFYCYKLITTRIPPMDDQSSDYAERLSKFEEYWEKCTRDLDNDRRRVREGEVVPNTILSRSSSLRFRNILKVWLEYCYILILGICICLITIKKVGFLDFDDVPEDKRC